MNKFTLTKEWPKKISFFAIREIRLICLAISYYRLDL